MTHTPVIVKAFRKALSEKMWKIADGESTGKRRLRENSRSG